MTGHLMTDIQDSDDVIEFDGFSLLIDKSSLIDVNRE